MVAQHLGGDGVLTAHVNNSTSYGSLTVSLFLGAVLLGGPPRSTRPALLKHSRSVGRGLDGSRTAQPRGCGDKSLVRRPRWSGGR
jgi:hypothetical protein